MNNFDEEVGFTVRLTLQDGKKIEFITHYTNIDSFVRDFSKNSDSYYKMTETQFIRKDSVVFIEEVEEEEPSELEKHITKIIDSKEANGAKEIEDAEGDTPLMSQMKRELETMKAKEEALKIRSR